jgi:hypothetical protein
MGESLQYEHNMNQVRLEWSAYLMVTRCDDLTLGLAARWRAFNRWREAQHLKPIRFSLWLRMINAEDEVTHDH